MFALGGSPEAILADRVPARSATAGRSHAAAETTAGLSAQTVSQTGYESLLLLAAGLASLVVAALLSVDFDSLEAAVSPAGFLSAFAAFL